MIDLKMTKKVKSTLALVLATAIILVSTPYAYGLISSQNTMNTSGIIANANTGVYSDAAATQSMTSITWGSCYPGVSYQAVAYIKNLGTVSETLTIQTANWTPSSASTPITLSSDYSGQTLTPNQVLKVTFTLAVASNIAGITAFSFNIVITSQG